MPSLLRRPWLTKPPSLHRTKKYFENIKREIKRPGREPIETCSTCQRLLRMSKGLRDNFTTSQTIRKQLKLGIGKLKYHLHVLKEKGLVSQDLA
jgi:hypothetical protein